MKKVMIILSIFLLVTVLEAQQTGTLNDTRDGKSYKTEKIGDQVWMAENLNYGTEEGSWCYEDSSSNCDKYGRLYDWRTAKKVCPSGWHIPTRAEFEALKAAVNSDGNSLKAIGQGTGAGAGTNTSGFSALLAGWRHDYGEFIFLGNYAYFWSSTENNSNLSGNLLLNDDNSSIGNASNYDKVCGFSIRCVKN